MRTLVSYLLYLAVGVALPLAGISITQQTLSWFAIMVLVALVDVFSAYDMAKRLTT